MRTAQIAVDYPAVVAGIATALNATVSDRAPHRHPYNAPPETWRRYLSLPDGLVIEARWYDDRHTWIDFTWINWPMDGNSQITPSQCNSLANGEAPDCYTRANATRTPGSIAAQVERKVIEPARTWLPVMLEYIRRRQSAEALALSTAQEIAGTFGCRFDPERDRRGHAGYLLWLGTDSPFGTVTVNGYAAVPEPSVSLYVDRCSSLTVPQLVAMIGAYRAHKEAGNE